MKRLLKRLQKKRYSILFVCAGNICRSPTAEVVMREHLLREGLGKLIDVDSAGTQRLHVGDPPELRATRAAAKRSYSMVGLRARQVGAGDYAEFDRILAMDRDNLAVLQRNCPPEHAHKLGLFLEYSRNFAEREVPDPYYGSEAGFEYVLDLIEDAASGLAEHLRGMPL